LKKRIITGILLSFVFFFSLYEGNILFVFSLSLIGVLVIKEIVEICQFSSRKAPIRMVLIASSLLFSGLIEENFRKNWASPLFLSISACLLGFSIFEIFKKKSYATNNEFTVIFRGLGLTLISIPYFSIIRNEPKGFVISLWLVSVIAISDIGALFVGKKWGKTPLHHVSPNKTIEGSIGGLFASTILGTILATIFHLPALKWAITAFIICILGQLGDLHESLLKRQFGVKDSSRILPGHGGVYDRFDSYIFAIPTFYFLYHLWL